MSLQANLEKKESMLLTLLQDNSSTSDSESIDVSQDIPSLYDEPKEPNYCGFYKRGSTIKTRLISVRDLNYFFFFQRSLDDQKRELVRSLPEHCSPSRPYSTRVGDIKIYSDENNIGHRCRIVNQYSHSSYGILQVYVEIFLIDTVKRLKNIHFSRIFDLPLSLDSIEPEAVMARLDIYLDNESRANEIFLREVKVGVDVDLKILDYQDGLYHVDILQSDESMIDKLVMLQLGAMSVGEDSAISSDYTSISSTLSQPAYRCCNAPIFNGGAKQFFAAHLWRHVHSWSNPEIGRYLFRVKLLYWADPHTIFIIPDIHDYFKTHLKFRDTLDRHCSSLTSQDVSNRNYTVGDCCFVRNNADHRLGQWLRAIVLKKSKVKISKKMVDVDRIANSNLVKLNPDQSVYNVRLIDFGFEWIKSSIEMRPVKDKKLFRSKGPWALNCRLFGVFPLTVQSNLTGQSFVDSCSDMVDDWIQGRSEDDCDRCGAFYVVFHSPLRSSNNGWLKPVHVALYHRFETEGGSEELDSTIECAKLSCLNVYLVENGYASQFNPTKGRNSEILLSQTSGTMIVYSYG